MPNYISTIAYVIGLTTLVSIGISDLRKREVNHEWRYIALIICGGFSSNEWGLKGISLIIIPAILILIGYLMAKKRNKAEGIDQQPKIEDIVGGADIKTISTVGWLVGPYIMAAGLILSVPLAIPFLINPAIGLKKGLETPDEKPSIPFCTLLAAALAIIFAVALCITQGVK